MLRRRCMLATVVLVLGFLNPGLADEGSRLRLVPFPKELELGEGQFALKGKLAVEGHESPRRELVLTDTLVLEAPAKKLGLLGGLIAAELKRAGLPVPEMRALKSDLPQLRVSKRPGKRIGAYSFRRDATAEDYALDVGPGEIVCVGSGDAGLFYGVQTLCQLIRANRRGDRLPCVTIRDWPSIRWRCFQDDLTRGPSSTASSKRSRACSRSSSRRWASPRCSEMTGSPPVSASARSSSACLTLLGSVPVIAATTSSCTTKMSSRSRS